MRCRRRRGFQLRCGLVGHTSPRKLQVGDPGDRKDYLTFSPRPAGRGVANTQQSGQVIQLAHAAERWQRVAQNLMVDQRFSSPQNPASVHTIKPGVVLVRPVGQPNKVLIIVSVDTEEDNWEPTRTNLSVENIRALPRLATFLRRLGVRPTLFASYQVLRHPWSGGILRDLAASGGLEIGTHLHPWNTPPLVEPLNERYTMLNNLPGQLQRSKLECLTAVYRDVLGWSPVSFRAGRFALGGEMVRALAELGYKVDSSVTPFISWTELKGPTFIGAPLAPYRLGVGDDPRHPTETGPVIELPLSAGFTRFRPSAWSAVDRTLSTGVGHLLRMGSWAARTRLMRRIVLSPETSSVRDMLALSRSLLGGGAAYLHLFFHSPSLLPGRTPYTRSRKDVEALYGALERYLEELTQLVNVRPVSVGEAAAALGFLPHPAPPSRADEPQVIRAAARPASGRTGASALPPASSTPRRRLLIITYHFPPDGAVGGLRWGSLAKYLQRLGWDVCVLTAAAGSTSDGPDGPVVCRCPRARTIIDRYRELLLRRGRDVNGEAATVRRRSPLRAELVAALSLPDESRGWALRAARRARALIRSFRPDVVVSSGPPHSAHLVARLATARSGIRWLVDLRDPWPHMVSQAEQWDSVHGTALARLFMPRVERAVMAAADGVLANTQLLANRLAGCYPDTAVVWVRNGFDPERLPPQAVEPHDGLLISYVGTLYGNRSLDVALEALRRYIDRRSAPPGAVRLQVVGDAEEPHRAQLRRAVSELRLDAYVVLRGPLPGSEALQLVRRSDLALVLAQGQDLQVPAKIYECIGMGIPTLVLAEDGSATAREAAWLGALVVEPHDADAMTDALERMQQRAGRIRPVPPEILYPRIAEQVSRLLSDPDSFVLQAWSEAGSQPSTDGMSAWPPATTLPAGTTRPGLCAP